MFPDEFTYVPFGQFTGAGARVVVGTGANVAGGGATVVMGASVVGATVVGAAVVDAVWGSVDVVVSAMVEVVAFEAAVLRFVVFF